MENQDFKPIKLSFNEQGYQRACKDAKDKLMALDKMLVWCANQGVFIKTKGLMKEFYSNPVGTFKAKWFELNSKKIELNVNVDKLLELCEVDIRQLQNLIAEVKQYRAEIGIEDDKKTKLFKYCSLVNKDDYTVYTKSKSENERVNKLKRFLKCLDDVGSFTKVYPANISQGLSNAVIYDFRYGKFVINNSMFS